MVIQGALVKRNALKIRPNIFIVLEVSQKLTIYDE
jgi:hypothetical protein